MSLIYLGGTHGFAYCGTDEHGHPAARWFIRHGACAIGLVAMFHVEQSRVGRDGLQSASYGAAIELRFNLTFGETQNLKFSE
jgi:hypothetical protein